MRAALAVLLLVVGCAEPAPFHNELSVTPTRLVDGFVPYTSDLGVSATVSGKVDAALPGVGVTLGVALASQTGTSASRAVSVVPGPDGAFSVPVQLVASQHGSTTLVAELGGLLVTSAPFTVPSGKLNQSYFERTDAGWAGCVELTGDAEELVFEADGGAVSSASSTRSCDGAADATSLLVQASADTSGWRVFDRGGALAPLALTGTASPRTLILSAGASSLPPAGEPLVIRFQVTAGDAPVAFASWRATVAPQGDGVTLLSGTADASGADSLVLVSPTAASLAVRLISGRAELVVQLTR